MNPPPTSIFTGSSARPQSTTDKNRRLKTPQARDLQAPPGEPLSKPSSPLHSPSQSALDSPWTNVDRAETRPSSVCTATLHHVHTPGGFVTTPPAIAGSKRSQRSQHIPAETAGPFSIELASDLHKRRRVSRKQHSLDHISFARSTQLHNDSQPPSPLFFSHSSRSRPHLPARFSSSEAAARMLSKTREDSGIKTVTLARGSLSALSPPGATPLVAGRGSERPSLPRTASPDSRERNDALRLLGSVGIVELLEQDTRPTFIVDIDDATANSASSSALRILFANNALRSNPPAWESVAGTFPSPSLERSASNASALFRGWLLRSESLDVNPSPVEHGGIIWSCYTLRKRLRVVTGAVPSPTTSTVPSTSASVDFTAPSLSVGPDSTTEMEVSPVPAQEPQDYFGNSSAPSPAAVHDSEQSSVPKASKLFDEHLDASQTKAEGPFIVPFKRHEPQQLPSFSHHATFTNECVLRAHAAGDVDAFHRDLSPPTEQTEHDVGFFDWTRLSFSPSLPKHIQFARSVDWAATPLGPIEFWSNDLRAMCNLIM